MKFEQNLLLKISREKNLFSFKKKFIKIGSSVFELIGFKKNPYSYHWTPPNDNYVSSTKYNSGAARHKNCSVHETFMKLGGFVD